MRWLPVPITSRIWSFFHATGMNKHLSLLLLQVKLRTSARSPVRTDKGISAPFAPSVWIRRRCSAPRCTTKVWGTQRGEPFFSVYSILGPECSIPEGQQFFKMVSKDDQQIPANHSLTSSSSSNLPYWANSYWMSVQHAHSSETLTKWARTVSELCL